MAYGLDKMTNGSMKVLVFDMGGGTLDVSVLAISQGQFDVIATRGDSHLGGQDIDALLTKHCMAMFEEAHDIDLKENKRAQARIRK